MKDPKYYDLVRTQAEKIDRAMVEITSNLAVLSAHGIVSIHDSMAVITKWSREVEAWIYSHLPKDEADHLIDELCEED